MNVGEALARAIRAQARGRCQYCLIHESLQGATFHVEHIVPRCKGGGSDFQNLALACPGCNLHKAGRTKAIDPVTGMETEIFHPKREAWLEHFRFDGYVVQGLTTAGRATVAVLKLNSLRRLKIREVEEMVGLFPPRD